MRTRVADSVSAARRHAIPFAAAFLVAIWPMLYNGFPLTYDDTGVYLGGPGDLMPPYPHFYTAFAFVLRHVATLYGVVAVQALLVISVVAIAIARLTGRGLSIGLVAAIIAVLAATQLPWLISTIMPDLLLAPGLLALLTLLFAPVGLVEGSFLFVMAVAAAVCATANALVMVPFAVVTAIVLWLVERRIGRPKAYIVAGFIALTAILPVIANLVIFEQSTYAIGSSARLFSKFVDRGIATPFLERECRTARYVACAHLSQIRRLSGGEAFLWSGEAEESGAWEDRADDFGRLNRAVIMREPGAVASAAMDDVITLLVRRPTLFAPEGREIISHATPSDSVYKHVARMGPGALASFLAARQQQDELAKSALDQAYRWSTWLSIAAALAALLVVARYRETRLTTVLLLLVGGVLLSTVVHGSLSTPVARYFVKVSWLLWLVPALAALRLFRGSTPAVEPRSYSPKPRRHRNPRL